MSIETVSRFGSETPHATRSASDPVKSAHPGMRSKPRSASDPLVSPRHPLPTPRSRKGSECWEDFQPLPQMSHDGLREKLGDMKSKYGAISVRNTLEADREITSALLVDHRTAILAHTCIDPGKQGKHLSGHPNHRPGKSLLLNVEPQKLIDEFAGTGRKVKQNPGDPGYVEKVDFGELVGIHTEQHSGKTTPTSWGKIHYDAKHRAHIVPALPDDPNCLLQDGGH